MGGAAGDRPGSLLFYSPSGGQDCSQLGLDRHRVQPWGEDWVGKLRPKSCCREKATLWSLRQRGLGLSGGTGVIHSPEGRGL